MLQLPRDIQVAFDRKIQQALVRREECPDYRKWLRFYLDFCSKYGHPPDSKGSLPRFLLKLASKNQSAERQAQAARSVGQMNKRKADDEFGLINLSYFDDPKPRGGSVLSGIEACRRHAESTAQVIARRH